jgi:uncharacterized MAPEG superfamily protein
MQPAIQMLLGYCLLTLLLVAFFVCYRASLVLSFKAAANSWPREGGQQRDPGLVTRAQHAHLNCVENLPVVGGIVCVACAMDKLDVLAPLALIFLGLRVAQSTTHLIGTTSALVFVRANFFLAQIGILLYWVYLLAR